MYLTVRRGSQNGTKRVRATEVCAGCIQRRTIADETVTNSAIPLETWKLDGRRRIDKRPNARVDHCVRRDSNYLCWSLSMQMPYLHSITARHAPINCRARHKPGYSVIPAPFLCPRARNRESPSPILQKSRLIVSGGIPAFSLSRFQYRDDNDDEKTCVIGCFHKSSPFKYFIHFIRFKILDIFFTRNM